MLYYRTVTLEIEKIKQILIKRKIYILTLGVDELTDEFLINTIIKGVLPFRWKITKFQIKFVGNKSYLNNHENNQARSVTNNQ